MTFTIPGEPQGKARPRVVKGHAYTPAKTKAYEEKVAWCYKQAGGRMIDGAVFMAITAYFKIPKNATKAQRHAMETGVRLPLKAPDCDNLAKCVLDGVQGLAYKNDSQVVGLVVLKRYGEPRVEVNIMGREDRCFG